MEGHWSWKVWMAVMAIFCFIVGFTLRLKVGHPGYLSFGKVSTSNVESHHRHNPCASDTVPESFPDVSFLRVGSTKILAFSAYLDVRNNDHDLIRIFALAPRRTLDERAEMTCRMICWQDSASPRCFHVTAGITMLHNHYNFEYAVFNFLCRIPKRSPPPRHVALLVGGHGGVDHDDSSVLMPVQNSEPSSLEHRFGVCLPTLFGGFGDTLLFVQSMESYRLLGAGFVTVYNSSVSLELDAVLRHYSRSGFVNVVQWPITDFLKPSSGWNINLHPGNMHYYGQIATMNDCMYRNMYRAQYLTMHDLDEIIVPRKWSNWTQMMEALDEPSKSAYYFRMHNFPVVETDVWTSRSGLRVQGTNILDYLVKVTYPPNEMATKTMVRPMGVQFHDVHEVLSLRPGFQVQQVPDHLAMVHHYKRWKKSWVHPSTDEMIRDTNLLRFSKEIEKRVKQVLKTL